MNKLSQISLLSLPLLLSLTAQADISVSGFGSLVMGQTLEKDEKLTADFYDVGQYENETTFKPESVLGLQVSSKIADDLKATGQLVAKGTDEFEPELDWYYLTYHASDNWTLMAGRRNIPMYYYSEFTEVGYAYPWVRPPSNLYWWQVTQFNGVHATYDLQLEDYIGNVTMFYGNEYSVNNKEMLYYAELYKSTFADGTTRITSVDENWTDITGINLNISGDIFDIRMVYFRSDKDRLWHSASGATETDPAASGFSQQFVGIGGSVNLNDLTILFDINRAEYDDDHGTVFPTYLVSLVYNIGQYQPYTTYSKADHYRSKADNEEDYEEHYMATLGVRYNLSAKASAKLQFDHFEDEGDKATGWDYHGNSQTIAAGVDFIF